MYDSGWAFLRRAGTFILASMVLVWALLYFPGTNAEGESYEKMIAAAEAPIKEQKEQLEKLEKSIAEPRKELARLDRQAEKGTTESGGLSTLFGLLGPSAAEREKRATPAGPSCARRSKPSRRK